MVGWAAQAGMRKRNLEYCMVGSGWSLVPEQSVPHQPPPPAEQLGHEIPARPEDSSCDAFIAWASMKTADEDFLDQQYRMCVEERGE